VHIKLPLLAAGGQEALQEVASKYQLQVGKNKSNNRTSLSNGRYSEKMTVSFCLLVRA
jgi:hypothetical protein